MPSMLSLIVGLDILRLLWRQESKLTRIVSLGQISMSLPERSPSAFPVPIRLHSQKTPIPQLSNDLSFCFGDTFLAIATHRFTFTPAMLGKKSAHISTFHHPLSIFPFLCVFLYLMMLLGLFGGFGFLLV